MRPLTDRRDLITQSSAKVAGGFSVGKTVFLTCCFLIISGTTLFAQTAKNEDAAVALKVVSVQRGVINSQHPDVQDLKYGIEGGNVVKVNGTYHLITTEMIGVPVIKTRIGHWTSADGNTWKRLRTLWTGDGDMTGTSQRSAIWGPMFIWNEDDQYWHIVYVCYKSDNKPNHMNYDGVIQHAISEKKGFDGIYAGFKDTKIILRYDDNPDPWEGLQGTDSFFPYKVGDIWLGFYGSATTQLDRKKDCTWNIGLAKAAKIDGKWKRMSELNPVNNDGKFFENPIVIPLKPDLFIAIGDGGPVSVNGGSGKPVYITSRDGIHWSNVDLIELEAATEKYWETMRTPLSLIKEENGTYTLFFTAQEQTGDMRWETMSKATVSITLP
jgi:hypothetical protein